MVELDRVAWNGKLLEGQEEQSCGLAGQTLLMSPPPFSALLQHRTN